MLAKAIDVQAEARGAMNRGGGRGGRNNRRDVDSGEAMEQAVAAHSRHFQGIRVKAIEQLRADDPVEWANLIQNAEDAGVDWCVTAAAASRSPPNASY
eukprot:SAG22_NODE_9548_length_583_cov_3.065982_2_plen_98_part_00